MARGVLRDPVVVGSAKRCEFGNGRPSDTFIKQIVTIGLDNFEPGGREFTNLIEVLELRQRLRYRLSVKGNVTYDRALTLRSSVTGRRGQCPR